MYGTTEVIRQCTVPVYGCRRTSINKKRLLNAPDAPDPSQLPDLHEQNSPPPPPPPKPKKRIVQTKIKQKGTQPRKAAGS